MRDTIYRAALQSAAEYLAALRVAGAPRHVLAEALDTLTLVYVAHKDGSRLDETFPLDEGE